MRFLPTLTLGIVVAAAASGRLFAADAPANIDSVLQDMLVRGAQFPPEKLLALGPEGFSAVLDRIFPETATIEEVDVADEVVDGLIADLGAENFQTREAASERLRALGPVARRAVTRAAQSQDAEVSYRAVRVLRGWEQRRQDDMTRYVAAMSLVLPKITDSPRLEELARRVRAVLDLGIPYGGKQQILRASVVTLYRAKDNRYLDPLAPLLTHTNPKVGVFCVQALGMAITSVNRPVTVDPTTGRVISTARAATIATDTPPPWVPNLLLKALESADAEILLSAVSIVPRRAPEAVLPVLRERLVKAFKQENETLKLRACAPLVALFDDADAIDFLLEQATQKANPSRRNEAINLWPQFDVPTRPVPPKLLAGLTPLLKSNEQAYSRQRAATILGGYAGPEVIAALTPYIADNYAPVAAEAKRRLLQQPDKKALRAALEAAAADKDNASLERAARQLLEQVERPT